MTQGYDFTNRTALITGAASGIGRAIAQRFAKEGWFVGLGDVNEKGMVETQHLIGLGFSFGHTFDVRDRDAWDEALNAFSMASGGRIDVVANNAGIPLGGTIDQNSVAEIERCLDINLKGVLFGAQAALPHLRAAGGNIVNVSSVSAFTGAGSSIAYVASKAAIDGISMSLARALGPEIRVMCVSPGAVATDFLAGRGRAQLEALMASSPLGRVTEPEDVARAIMACITHLKATTGDKIIVDGGRFLG